METETTPTGPVVAKACGEPTHQIAAMQLVPTQESSGLRCRICNPHPSIKTALAHNSPCGYGCFCCARPESRPQLRSVAFQLQVFSRRCREESPAHSQPPPDGRGKARPQSNLTSNRISYFRESASNAMGGGCAIRPDSLRKTGPIVFTTSHSSLFHSSGRTSRRRAASPTEAE